MLIDAWHQLGAVPCVLEQRLPLDRELSVVLARTADGRVACYHVSQNQHVDGILDISVTPASLAGDGHDDAAALCTYIAEELGFVGVMAVEMFVVGNDVLVNELAPRPHNSGHWTLDACTVSQFEQQVRALCGLPLGNPGAKQAAVMVNLLGDLWFDAAGRPITPAWSEVLALPGTHLHLYGKLDARKGRKMGHLNITGTDVEGVRATALQAASLLGIPAF